MGDRRNPDTECVFTNRWSGGGGPVAPKMSAKWYTPQLSRELVSRLYFKAKAERIRVTVLMNRIVKEALARETAIQSASETKALPLAKPMPLRDTSPAGAGKHRRNRSTS